MIQLHDFEALQTDESSVILQRRINSKRITSKKTKRTSKKMMLGTTNPIKIHVFREEEFDKLVQLQQTILPDITHRSIFVKTMNKLRYKILSAISEK